MKAVKLDNKCITIIYFGVSVLAFIIWGNRSLFIGSVWSYILIKRPRSMLIWLSIVFLCAVGLIIFIKGDSSLGRVLVYKISFSILRDNWVYGCGLGEFGKVYLLEQAKYFSSPGFTTKELLLADNTIYAFNDWFQFICETGILGVVSISLFCYSVYRLDTFFENSKFFWHKVLSLTVLLAAIFTHLFEKEHVLIFLTIIFFSMVLGKIEKPSSSLKLFILFTIVLIGGVLKGSHSIYWDYQLKESIKLSNSGQFYRSNLMLNKLKEKGYCGSDCLFFYSRNVAGLGRIDDALPIMEKLAVQESNSLYHSLLADLYLAKGNVSKAEGNLVQAINMVPNRFEERHKLLELYLQTHDSINALKVASEILNLPVKVNSDRIEFIKQYSTHILNTN